MMLPLIKNICLFHFVRHLISLDTTPTPISFCTSHLVRFVSTAAEIVTFSTRLIFLKTIPGSIFHVILLCPFLSYFMHFQALQLLFFSFLIIFLFLIHLFFLVNLPPYHFCCHFPLDLTSCPKESLRPRYCLILYM